jgi:hypothetical protein
MITGMIPIITEFGSYIAIDTSETYILHSHELPLISVTSMKFQGISKFIKRMVGKVGSVRDTGASIVACQRAGLLLLCEHHHRDPCRGSRDQQESSTAPSGGSSAYFFLGLLLCARVFGAGLFTKLALHSESVVLQNYGNVFTNHRDRKSEEA